MQFVTTVLAVIALIALAPPAAAYLGPGAGLGAIGAVIALFAALALAVVGFVWYPVKRLVAAGRSRRRQPVERDAPER
jgi:hypothetical protein